MQSIDTSALYNADAERSVLGALLQDPQTLRVAMDLNKGDFYYPAHQEIYDAIRAVETSGRPVDLVTIDEELDKRDTLLIIGGPSYLVGLTQYVPTTANTRAYVDIVLDYSCRRMVLKTVQDSATRILVGMDDVGEICLDTTNALRQMQKTRYQWTGMSEIICDTVDLVERRRAGEDRRIQTGLAKVDSLFYGFVATEFTVIGARPSVGKSSLAQWIAKHASLNGFKVGFISLEMSKEQYGMRTLSALSGVGLSKIRDGNMTDSEYEKYVDAVGPSSAMDVKYAFSTRNVEDVYAMAQQMKDKFGLDIVIVDYLQILSSAKNFQNDNARVAHISRTLKGLAMDLDIPVIAVAQLSRDARTRRDKRPIMSDLRDSGAIEQDADNIMMMHRFDEEDEVGLGPDDVGFMRSLEQRGGKLVQIRVLKQRQGEAFETNVAFFQSQMRFGDV